MLSFLFSYGAQFVNITKIFEMQIEIIKVFKINEIIADIE
jgi:hypothetical protein